MSKYRIQPHDVIRIHSWITQRSGLLIWKSLDLSTAGTGYITPAIDEHGKPYTKPNWRSANEPFRKIESVEEVEVVTRKEVKRFHVAVKRGSGFSFVLTDASSRRLREQVDKASEKYGTDAWYEFDYGDYKNAVIFVIDRIVPLTEFILGEKNESEIAL